MEGSRNSAKKIILLNAAIVGLLAVAVLGVLSLSDNNAKTNAAATAQAPASEKSASVPAGTTVPAAQETTAQKQTAPLTKFKDGTYSSNARYSFPNGSDVLSLNVTLKGDKITDASVSIEVTDHESEEYVNSFLRRYKTVVVGKDVSSLQLSRVAGSSLTSNGFNDALDKIRQQAS